MTFASVNLNNDHTQIDYKKLAIGIINEMIENEVVLTKELASIIAATQQEDCLVAHGKLITFVKNNLK